LIDAIAGKICVDLAGLSISIGEQRPDVHQDEVGRALDFEVFYTSGPRSLGNHCGARSKYEPGRIAPAPAWGCSTGGGRFIHTHPNALKCGRGRKQHPMRSQPAAAGVTCGSSTTLLRVSSKWN